MGLRSKVFLYVGGILIVLFFVVYNVLSHLLINDFLALERKETEQNLLRVNDALQAKIDELGVKISDWGQWDDTFVFVQDRNQEWIDSNTQNEGLEILSINILMVVDNEKQIVFKKYIDASGEDRDFPKGLEEYLVSHPELLTHADSASEQHGVIAVPEGQLVLAARAITSSDGGEAPAGTIIFAYFIGESLIEHLSNVTHLQVFYTPYEEIREKKDEAQALSAMTDNSTAFIPTLEESASSAVGYTLVSTLDNSPAGVLRVEFPRGIFMRGQNSLKLFSYVMLFLSVLFIFVVISLLEILVIRRIIRLSMEVDKVSLDRKENGRVSLSGNDEFSRLAKKINEMLQMLHEVNEKIIEEKEKSEAILRFLKSIGEGVFATNIEGKIIFMNEAAERMAGKLFVDVEKKDADKVFSFVQSVKGEQIPLSLVASTLKKAHHISFPLQSFLVQKKKQIPVSGTCSIIRDPNQEVIGTITVLQDVTKKHELDQMKDGFLSVAAHQLRTPLGSMRWSMELLLNGDFGKLPKEAKEAVQQVYDNSERMIALANDLLNVSRIDQNHGIEKKESVDLVAVLQAAIQVMTPEAQKNSIQINLVVKNKPISGIMAPPKHLHEAFGNLLSNGIKYNKKGGRIDITVSQDEKAVSVTIADTGIGIPKEDQSKIFSKFFRASNAVLKQTDGSGLGLSVVKSYLEEANARISFQSQENKGSTFSILFPFHPTDS